jgi:cell division protease FtsH
MAKPVLKPKESKPSGAPRPSAVPATSPRRPRFRWWLAVLVGLLVLNYWAGSRATQAASRVRVPYSPFFLQQVNQGHVVEITSKGTAIQGTFSRPESYRDSKATTRFRTEIPEFADTKALSQLLERKRVTVNAQPLDKGGPWWENLLLGFGPTILFVGLLFWLMRRAGSVQNMLGSFGRSSARRYEPSGERVTFADVAGIDEA